ISFSAGSAVLSVLLACENAAMGNAKMLPWAMQWKQKKRPPPQIEDEGRVLYPKIPNRLLQQIDFGSVKQ
ncbi:MAG: hypothetical protein QF918_06265, partial [Pirellulaceae bacterium]|nr:hypothetical protein [Pirellulaceae bacterium]